MSNGIKTSSSHNIKLEDVLEQNYNFIEDLSDGEVLDLIFAKFGIEDVDDATEQLLRKIDKVLLLTTFQREEVK